MVVNFVNPIGVVDVPTLLEPCDADLALPEDPAPFIKTEWVLH
jgi:hypothetical protein